VNRVVKQYEGKEIHVIVDNLSTPKPKRDLWLARHPNVHFHYTPTHTSWLNQIEIWFSILAARSLKGASFGQRRRTGGSHRKPHQQLQWGCSPVFNCADDQHGLLVVYEVTGLGHSLCMIRGHFAYYGVGGNSRRLRWFANQVVRVWRKWLSRRDRQRGHMDPLQRTAGPAPTASCQDSPWLRRRERISLVKNRMREICTSGSVSSQILSKKRSSNSNYILQFVTQVVLIPIRC
jgi:hypothetical protein